LKIKERPLAKAKEPGERLANSVKKEIGRPDEKGKQNLLVRESGGS